MDKKHNWLMYHFKAKNTNELSKYSSCNVEVGSQLLVTLEFKAWTKTDIRILLRFLLEMSDYSFQTDGSAEKEAVHKIRQKLVGHLLVSKAIREKGSEESELGQVLPEETALLLIATDLHWFISLLWSS